MKQYTNNKTDVLTKVVI